MPEPACAANGPDGSHAPPQSNHSMPSTLPYQSRIAAGSSHLKKSPPTPSTFAMVYLSPCNEFTSRVIALAPTSGAKNGITEQAMPTKNTAAPLRFRSATASA